MEPKIKATQTFINIVIWRKSISNVSYLFLKIGNWGFKRYHRDGYGCVLEDLKKNQRFYEDGATQHFEHVESEWPVFHTFMIIDGLFKNNDSQVEKHQRLLKPLLKYTEKGGMNPRKISVQIFSISLISFLCILVWYFTYLHIFFPNT